VDKYEFTNQDLENYIQFFPDTQRENVLKEILESRIIQEYLATTEGRLLLGSVIDEIRDCTMQIVSAGISGKASDEAADTMKQYSLRINAGYNLMYRLATLAGKGEVHVKEMKRRKKVV